MASKDGRILLERLCNLADNPEESSVLEMLEQASKDIEDSVGHQGSATSTQARQDLHLRELITVARIQWKMRVDEQSDEVIQKKLFNLREAEFLTVCKLYLAISLREMQPRGGDDEHPRYKTLLQRQASILFWAERESANVERKKLLNCTNEVLQFAAQKYGVNREPVEKPYLGRLELNHLLERETWIAPSLVVAENHFLAWTLGMVCGVRPGSLGPSKHRPNDYLAWKDLTFTRGASKGMFDVRVEFRFLSGNEQAHSEQKTLKLRINSPTSVDQIPLSPPIRILVIALRRNLLAKHTTLDSLLNGLDKHIKLKASCKEEPVLLASAPRGMNLAYPHQPLSVKSLTRYLSEKAMQAGYSRHVSFYSWRRKAATEMVRQMGLDKAKLLLGHDPKSDILTKHYDQGTFDLPVFETAVRADTSAAIKSMDENSSIALTRLVDQTRVEGLFLEREIRKLEAGNDELRQARKQHDLEKIRQVKKRIKRQAKARLFDQEREKQNDEMTTHEYNRRRDELNAPRFMKEMKKANKRHPEETDVLAGPPGKHANNTLQPLPRFRHGDIRDAEDQFNEVSADEDVEIDVDDFAEGEEEQEDATEFFRGVQLFMQTMGQETFVVQDNKDLRCSLCIEDDTMSEAAKAKIWRNDYYLREHQLSREHNKKQKFMRRLDLDAASRNDGLYICPYGGMIECKRYKNRKTLLDHLFNSTVHNTSEEHEELKADDGWFDDDWEYDMATVNPKAYRQQCARGEKTGIIFSKETELSEETPLELNSRFVVMEGGGGLMVEIKSLYEGIVFSGDTHGVGETLHGQPIPKLYENIVGSGADWEDTGVPDMYKDVIFEGLQ